jgi:hypothetical protein
MAWNDDTGFCRMFFFLPGIWGICAGEELEGRANRWDAKVDVWW